MKTHLLNILAFLFCFISLPSLAGHEEEILQQAIRSCDLAKVTNLLKSQSKMDYVIGGRALSDAIGALEVKSADSVIRIVSLLLDQGANTGYNGGWGGATPLSTILRKTEEDAPLEKRMAIVELLMNHGASLDFEGGHMIVVFFAGDASSYEPKIMMALFSAIPPDERESLKEQLPGLMKGLTAVFKSTPKPPKDIRKLISKMVIEPLIMKHFDYIKDMVRAVMDKVYNSQFPNEKQIEMIDNLFEFIDQKFQAEMRPMVEKNIRLALFGGQSEVANPSNSPVSLSQEHEAAINAFLKAFKERNGVRH
jgi:hypothetical protein